MQGPSGPRDVPRPGRGQVEGALAVGKRPDDPGSTSDFPLDALERMVGADAPPFSAWIQLFAEGSEGFP